MIWAMFLACLAATVAPTLIFTLVLDRKFSVGWMAVYITAMVVGATLTSYFTIPALTGPFNGILVFAGMLLFSALTAGVIAYWQNMFAEQRSSYSRYNDRPVKRPLGYFAMACGSAAMLVFMGGLAIFAQVTGTWGDGNVHDWANIPHVQKVATTLPSTDVHHIVLVTKDVAQNSAQQSIGSNGQNLGSQFSVSDCQEQAIRQHIYWVCPLVYQNFLAQYNGFFTQKPLPGFIVVDAENPDAQPVFKLGYHILYSSSASFGHNLKRHVYDAGYSNANLSDPTLELDDNWQPFYTISYTTPTKAFGGDVITKVLVVNAQTGAIAAYRPNQTPEWVDRIVPRDFAAEWASNYGKYHNLPWINWSGFGRMKPASGDPEMVYNSADHPVWLIPMTSNSDSDTSSTGFLEISTRYGANNLPDTKFFPLGGYATGGTVSAAFAHNPSNLRNYAVSSPVLYSIDGNPTWIATFTSSTDNGDFYQQVGLLDATPGHVNGANVVMRQTLEEALADYPAQLVAEGQTTYTTSQGTPSKTFTAKITRINQNTLAGKTTYYVMFEGYTQIFTATADLSAQIVVAEVGDTATFSFTDTGQKVVPLRSFSDTTIGA